MNTERLYEARKKKGLSQEELANICGVSRQAVSKWESGQSTPDADNLLAISKALDISIDYLLNNESASVQKVKLTVDYDDFMQQENAYSGYEYKSKTTIGGIPLVHINYSRYGRFQFGGGFPRRKMRVAKGIFALGDISIGLVALGYMSIGLFNFGIIGMGLIGLSLLQFGLFAFGIIAVGFSAVGILAVGVYSMGVAAIALDTAAGVLAVGKYSIGVESFGRYFNVKLGENGNNICQLPSKTIILTQNAFAGKWLPWPIKALVEFFITCP